MALALDISPDMEALLRLKAAKNNQDITTYLLKLVEKDLNIDLSEHDGLEDYASSVTGIEEGLEDFNAGNTISFEEWCDREAERKQERHRQTTRSPEKVGG